MRGVMRPSYAWLHRSWSTIGSSIPCNLCAFSFELLVPFHPLVKHFSPLLILASPNCDTRIARTLLLNHNLFFNRIKPKSKSNTSIDRLYMGCMNNLSIPTRFPSVTLFVAPTRTWICVTSFWSVDIQWAAVKIHRLLMIEPLQRWKVPFRWSDTCHGACVISNGNPPMIRSFSVPGRKNWLLRPLRFWKNWSEWKNHLV